MFINVIHKTCGCVAFLSRVQPRSGMALKASDVIFPDGTMPTQGERVICFSCKEEIYTNSETGHIIGLEYPKSSNQNSI